MLLALVWFQLVLASASYFNYYGNNYNTYFPGQMVVNTIPYYAKRFPPKEKLVEVVDHLPGLYPSTMRQPMKIVRFNESKTFERYLKTYFEPQAGIQADILRYKFSSLESNMESVENKSHTLIKKLKQLDKMGGCQLEEFWFLQYQKRSMKKLMKALNSSKLQPYSKMLVPGVKLPWNSSDWIKSFDEIFEELKEGEPLVEPELFMKQKAWWIQSRKKICLFKIEQLRNYIKSVDNFFYQNRDVLSVHRWIRDRESLYSRKLSDLFWWLCRRDQYFREEYARLDYEKVWTPWLTTTLPPHLTTFDFFRYNGDFHYLLRRRNKFYAKFFKRKKIFHFIKRLQPMSTVSTTHHIFGFLFDQYKYLTSFPSDMINKDLVVATEKTNAMKMFCFQYFGKVRYVGLRTTIYRRIKEMYPDSIRGYIMYTHRGTVFGKVCGNKQDVDDIKTFLKRLKTPTSKVTKLEFRGECPIQRFPKGLKKFHFYKGLFEDGVNNIPYLRQQYSRLKSHDKVIASEDEYGSENIEYSEPVTDHIDHQVNRLFRKYGDGIDGNCDKRMLRKYNLKIDGIY
ncbi:hypothetical protein M8J77_001375 [Diaphorina citri]|nr:hypothetical protein M8J77_001375 [Diaphorina citri]